MGKKFAVVGCGYWGPNIIRNLVGNNQVDQVFVCDLSEEKLKGMRARFPSIVTTTSYDDILKNEAIDAVMVVTPIATHFELAKAALEAGKHVCVEKPMAATAVQARKLNEIAKERKRVLMVGHTFEFSAPVLKIKSLLNRGEIGNLYYISSTRINLGIHRPDGSVIWDLAPHDFSIIFYWLNELPARVSAMGRGCIKKELPDVVFVNMEFPSGVVAHISLSWLSPTKLRQMLVVGDKKMCLYDDAEVREKVKIFDHGVDFKDPVDFGEFHLSYRTGDIISPKLPVFEPLGRLIAHFIDCIEHQQNPKTDGLSGLHIVETLEATERSLREGGRPIETCFKESVYKPFDVDPIEKILMGS